MKKLVVIYVVVIAGFCALTQIAHADQEGNGRGDDRGSEIESEAKK